MYYVLLVLKLPGVNSYLTQVSFCITIARALRGCFHGGSVYVSFRFVSKERKTSNAVVFFDILTTSKGASALGMF